MLPHLNSGKIKLLAVATASRIPQAPDLPTVGETLPGFQFGSWNGFMVPGGTPKEIIDKLVEGSIEAVNTPSVKEKLVQSGIVPGGTTPAQVAERFKADRKVFATPCRSSGLNPGIDRNRDARLRASDWRASVVEMVLRAVRSVD